MAKLPSEGEWCPYTFLELVQFLKRVERKIGDSDWEKLCLMNRGYRAKKWVEEDLIGDSLLLQLSDDVDRLTLEKNHMRSFINHATERDGHDLSCKLRRMVDVWQRAMTIPRDQPEYLLEAWVENNDVRGHVERNPTPDFSASNTDFTDPEYDPIDSSIEFHALDDISDSETTDDDLEGEFDDDELGEFTAWEPEWFDEDDPEGDF